MTAARKLAAILAADVVGFSRLAGADEDRTLARLRALRSDLIDPSIAIHNGRVVKRTCDGLIAEFGSVVDAVRCAIEVQRGMAEHNAGVAPEKRIEFRIGVHLGDVVEEADGDLMGDGVNIAARLESIAEAGGLCLSGGAYEQVRDRVKEPLADLREKALKNIARPVRVYGLDTGSRVAAQPYAAPAPEKSGAPRHSIVVLPFANLCGDASQDYFVDGVTESLTTDLSRPNGMLVIGRNTAFTYKGKAVDLRQVGRELNVRYVLEGSVQRGQSDARECPTRRCRDRQSPMGRALRQALGRSFRHAGRNRCARGECAHEANRGHGGAARRTSVKSGRDGPYFHGLVQ